MSFLSALLAVALAFVFVTTGLPKVTLAPGALRTLGRIGVPPAIVRLAGVTETAGAVGLVAGIWVPWLGVLAASLLAVQMVAAVAWHLVRHDDAPNVVPPLLLLLGCALAIVLRLASAG